MNLGKSCFLASQNSTSNKHRDCQISFPGLSVMSAYGPAKACDPKWFSEITFASHASQKLCQLIVGDFNWGDRYDPLIPADWHMATPPSRALSTHPVQQTDACPLPVFPPSLAVLFKVRLPLNGHSSVPHQKQRLRKCATFRWTARSGLSDADLKDILFEADKKYPLLDPTVPLASRWRQWHKRVETAFESAVH